jgi:hypothetical protein
MWTVSCGRDSCHRKVQFEAPHDATDGQVAKEAARHGWLTHKVGAGPLARDSRFCSRGCLELALRSERLHRPDRYLGWLEVYGLDPHDLHKSRRMLGQVEEKHREVATHLVTWLLDHEAEARNMSVEFARWKLKGAYKRDPDEVLHEEDIVLMAIAGENRTLDVLIWRTKRREVGLFSLLGPAQGPTRSRERHRVWHWSDYGVVCPSLWLTKGDIGTTAERICDAVGTGLLEVDADGDLEPDVSSPDALVAQFQAYGGDGGKTLWQ